jgi:hypothetical protein
VARIQVVLRSKNACIPCSRDGVARADSPGVAVRQLAGQVRRHFRHPHRLPRGGNPPPPPAHAQVHRQARRARAAAGRGESCGGAGSGGAGR